MSLSRCFLAPFVNVFLMCMKCGNVAQAQHSTASSSEPPSPATPPTTALSLSLSLAQLKCEIIWEFSNFPYKSNQRQRQRKREREREREGEQQKIELSHRVRQTTLSRPLRPPPCPCSLYPTQHIRHMELRNNNNNNNGAKCAMQGTKIYKCVRKTITMQIIIK